MPSRIGHGKGMEQHNDPGKALRCRWRSLRRTAKQKDSHSEGIARLTVTAATMAAMTGSSLISPFTAFAQTGDGGTQHPAVMSPIAAHAGATAGTGA